MTVQELINALNKVEDKSKIVHQHDDEDIDKVVESIYGDVILYYKNDKVKRKYKLIITKKLRQIAQNIIIGLLCTIVINVNKIFVKNVYISIKTINIYYKFINLHFLKKKK